MTTQTIVPRALYAANGVQTAFGFTFPVFEAGDMEVWVDQSLQTGSAYTISGVGVAVGGTVIFTVPPPASSLVTLRRHMPLNRTPEFPDTSVQAKPLNEEFTYHTAALQQLADETSLAVKRSFHSLSSADLTLPEPAAGKAIGWNATGDGLTNDPADFAGTVAATSVNAAAAAASAASSSESAAAAASSAASASTSASNAATSASNASTSASSAAASASAADVAKIQWQGAWSAATAYALNDAVSHGGSSWICIQAHTDQIPADGTYWDKLAAKGTDGIGAGDMLADNNLSDLANPAIARINLGLGSAATLAADTDDALSANSDTRLPSQRAVKAYVDANAGGGTETITAGEALAALDAIYLDDGNLRNGGTDRWYKIDTDAVGSIKVGRVRGIALGAIASGATGQAQTGPGVVAGLSGLTAGQAMYASSTAGAMTQTEPAVPASGTQNTAIIMGHALSATTMRFEPWGDVVFQRRNSALASGSSITVEHWTDGGARERVARAYLAVPAAYSTDLTGSGTPLANGSSGGFGAANAYDNNAGTYWQSAEGTAAAVNGVSWIGYDFGAGIAKHIRRFTIKQYGGSNCVTSVKVEYSDDGSTYSLADTIALTADSGTYTKDVAASGAHRYWRLRANSNSTANQWCTHEIELMELGASRGEPLTIGSETIDASTTTKVTVKYADSSDANQDTNTTFYNRTGATRDLILEVTL